MRDLEIENAALRATLARMQAAMSERGFRLEGDALVREPWAEGMTPQQIAVVNMLRKAYPEPVGRWKMLEELPGYGEPDRDLKLVAVLVHYVRAKLGAGSVENLRGVGYRLTEAGMAAIAREPAQFLRAA